MKTGVLGSRKSKLRAAESKNLAETQFRNSFWVMKT
jgi:hypothetical protein